jgi:hypothetical protein
MRTLQRRRRCQKHRGADRDSAPDMLSHFFKVLAFRTACVSALQMRHGYQLMLLESPNYAFPHVTVGKWEAPRLAENDC